MILIFGLRVYFWTIARGTFYCQRCGGDRSYRHRAGRRFFHLFFVPLIPLGKAGEHVQCDTCRTKYRTEVLAMPTSAQMQASIPDGTRVAAIAVLRAGDPASTAVRRRAVEVIKGSGMPGYDEAALDADLAGVATAEQMPVTDPAAALSALSGQLAVPAREWFLAEIVRIGLADGPLTDGERQAIMELAGQLGMTPAQAIGVITLTEQGAAAGQ